MPLTILIVLWLIQFLGIFLGYGLVSALKIGLCLAAAYTALYFLGRWIVGRLSGD